MRYLLIPVFVFNTLAALAGTVNHKAHVHGIGKLTIAIESATKAVVDLDVPADSIYGFEHKAQTDKERADQGVAYRLFRDKVGTLVGFDSALDCKFKIKKIGVENEAEEHQDFNVSYEVNCARPLAGTQIQVHLMRYFPRIHKLSVQVLGEAAQSQNEVKDDNQSIGL